VSSETKRVKGLTTVIAKRIIEVSDLDWIKNTVGSSTHCIVKIVVELLPGETYASFDSLLREAQESWLF
jgi:hypothetical protein